MVAIAATISVVFTTCNSDDEKSTKFDNSYFLIGIFWCNYWTDDGSQDSRYGIKFNNDGTYSYDTPTESVAGNYKISESLSSMGVVSHSWRTQSNIEREIDYTLFKMNVSGSSDFDQLWVYLENGGFIIVHFYSNNVLVRKPAFGKYYG